MPKKGRSLVTFKSYRILFIQARGKAWRDSNTAERVANLGHVSISIKHLNHHHLHMYHILQAVNARNALILTILIQQQGRRRAEARVSEKTTLNSLLYYFFVSYHQRQCPSGGETNKTWKLRLFVSIMNVSTYCRRRGCQRTHGWGCKDGK